MKKAIGLFLVLTMSVSMMVGCGSKTSNDTAKSDTASSTEAASSTAAATTETTSAAE